MKQKMELALCKGYCRIQKMMKREDGMETLETVILIAVAVVVAGAIILALTGSNHKGGIIKDLFDTFKKNITNLMK